MSIYPRKTTELRGDYLRGALDWNAMVEKARSIFDGFSPSGTFSTANKIIFNYAVIESVTYYYASNAYQTIYGGPTSVGGVDGTDSAAVIQAAVTAYTGSFYFKLGTYNAEGVSLGHTPSNYSFDADRGTVINGLGGGNLISWGGAVGDSGSYITFNHIIFDTSMQNPLAAPSGPGGCHAIGYESGTFDTLIVKECVFLVTQVDEGTAYIDYECPNPVYFHGVANNVWIEKCKFINMGTGTVRVINLRGGGSNAWIVRNVMRDCNNPAFTATGTSNCDFDGYHYLSNTHEYSAGLYFPAEGNDLENVKNVEIIGTIDRELGPLNLGVGMGAGGGVCASGTGLGGGPVAHVIIDNCIFRSGWNITYSNTTDLWLGKNNHNINSSNRVLFADGAGAALGGWGTASNPTPSLPIGAGVGNAVANPYPWDVEVYMVGSVDRVVLQPYILDVYGRYSALPDVRATYLVLQPYEAVFFGTAVPTSWLWKHCVS
jgi:hypothetical protein